MGDKIHRNSLQPGYKLHWYRIEKILGQGGFGITYLAHDFNLDRQVAIKEYLPIELAVRERDFSVHPVTEEHGEKFRWGLDRFITEARTLVKFKHPNIVHVLNVFEANNTAYMVMEYEQGESLQEILTRRKTMEEAELINILIPILGGLQKVQDAGFIHRDIKPANIFIRKDGSPVLLDFGSARQALGIATQTLTSLVSPGYAPYEQYYSKSDQQGPWSDIYGLGATLYRAIAGVAPMDAVDRSRTILKGEKDIFVPASQIGKGRYSERFLLAIDHALQFKEGDRPQTVNAWKAEFDLSEDPIKKADTIERKIPTQLDTRVLAKRQQKKWLFIKTALLGVIISITIAYFYRDEIQNYFGPTKEQIETERQRVEEQKRAEAEAQRLAEIERQRQEETLAIDESSISLAHLGRIVSGLIPGGPDLGETMVSIARHDQKAAEQGDVKAQYDLGSYYHYGLGVTQNFEKAVYWYQKATEQGYAVAQYSLGVMYLFGKVVPQDAKQAAYWIQKAAEQGYAEAQYTLGVMCFNGKGVPQDAKQAAYWIQKAAEQSGAWAQYNLGVMYFNGKGVPKDFEKAVYWFQKSAKEHGDSEADAIFVLRFLYQNANGVPQVDKQPVQQLQMTAELGDAKAQYNLGVRYILGLGVPQDDKLALDQLQKAAEQGYAVAQYSLGVMYLFGKAVPQDDKRATYWFQKAAELGDADAQYNLGIMYHGGLGVPQDSDKALYWYQKAAEQGDTRTQHFLGLLYKFGEGVPKDYEHAVHWFQKAAEQGDADGQYNLGMMYLDGKGVPQDNKKAIYWIQKAADQGNEDAIKFLSERKQ